MSHLEGLREEPLDLPGPRDGELVLLGELVHTQDGDDVLQGLVVLEDLLDATRDLVVILANDVGVHDPGCGVEGIDGGVDSQLGDALGEKSIMRHREYIQPLALINTVQVVILYKEHLLKGRLDNTDMSKKSKYRLRDSALYVTMGSGNLSFDFFDISVETY